MRNYLLMFLIIFPLYTLGEIRVSDRSVGNIRQVKAQDSESTLVDKNKKFACVNNYKSIEKGTGFNISPIFEMQEMTFQENKYQKSLLSFEIYSDTFCPIYEGSKLAIKLDNDSIIVLSAFSSVESKNYEAYSGYQYNATPSYEISDADLENLINHKVSKIRLSANENMYNFTFPNDEFSIFLGEAIPLVRKKFSTDSLLDNL